MADYIIVHCSVQCEEFCSDVPCLPSACIRSVTSSLGVQYAALVRVQNAFYSCFHL